MAPPELAAKLKEGALPTQVIQVPNANLASIDWAVKLNVRLAKYPPRFDGVREGL